MRSRGGRAWLPPLRPRSDSLQQLSAWEQQGCTQRGAGHRPHHEVDEGTANGPRAAQSRGA